MKKIFGASFITILFIGIYFLTGCANFNLASLGGVNIQDLEDARSSGMTKTYKMPYDAAFNEVKKTLTNNDLYIYQISRKKGFIVVTDFPKQVDTTRVGIFFESVSKNETKVTLSSLSDTALGKAGEMIFGITK